MGMGKKSWKWEGMGIKVLLPHTSSAEAFQCPTKGAEAAAAAAAV